MGVRSLPIKRRAAVFGQLFLGMTLLIFCSDARDEEPLSLKDLD